MILHCLSDTLGGGWRIFGCILVDGFCTRIVQEYWRWTESESPAARAGAVAGTGVGVGVGVGAGAGAGAGAEACFATGQLDQTWLKRRTGVGN